jgi:hypothetical protein
MENKYKVDALIRDNCHITTSELCTATGIGTWQLWPSSENLAAESLHKVRAENTHRGTQNSPKKKICAEFLQQSEKDKNNYW